MPMIGDLCSCGTNNFISAAVMHVRERGHHAVIAQFKCRTCQQKVWRTYEMTGVAGKVRRWGEHFKQAVWLIDRDDCDREYRYAVLEQIFDEMWDGDAYRLPGNCCVEWCQLFMAKVRQSS